MGEEWGEGERGGAANSQSESIELFIEGQAFLQSSRMIRLGANPRHPPNPAEKSIDFKKGKIKKKSK